MVLNFLNLTTVNKTFAWLDGFLPGIMPAPLYRRLFRRLPSLQSCESIRVNIVSKWLANNKDCTVIAFASRQPGEGVSTVVAGLARSFGVADMGTTLVIESAYGQHTISRLLEAELPEQTTGQQSHISRCDEYSLDIMTLNEPASGVTTSRDNARSLIDTLRASYQLILVDAGSLTRSSCAYWLRASDYRVMVIDSTITTHEVLEHLRNYLVNLGINLDGAILNKRIFPIPKSLYWLAR